MPYASESQWCYHLHSLRMLFKSGVMIHGDMQYIYNTRREACQQSLIVIACCTTLDIIHTTCSWRWLSNYTLLLCHFYSLHDCRMRFIFLPNIITSLSGRFSRRLRGILESIIDRRDISAHNVHAWRCWTATTQHAICLFKVCLFACFKLCRCSYTL